MSLSKEDQMLDKLIEVLLKTSLKTSAVNLDHIGLENLKHQAFTSVPQHQAFSMAVEG